MMDCEVAISCLNDDLFKIEGNLENIFNLKGVFIHIVHQVNNNQDYSGFVDDFLNKIDNIRYSKLTEIGLPVSRNFALHNCKAKYLIPTDSDIIFFKDELLKVEKIFSEYPEADYITLKSYYDFEKKKPRKKFNSKVKFHNRRSLLSVSSIEIVLKVHSFQKENVQWDQDFGLGARFGGGLETVMLQSAHKARLKGIFYPIPLCYHPDLSSGLQVSLKKVYIRSAVFEKIFGVFWGKFLSLVFHLKNYKDYKEFKIFDILKLILKNKYL